MPNYTYKLTQDGLLIREGPIFLEVKPKVGSPLFGTPDEVWLLKAITDSSDGNADGVLECTPADAAEYGYQ